MVMVKVPKGTRRVPRTDEHPPKEWTIILDLSTIPGGGTGEAEIGYTERRGREWRAFPANAVTWSDHRKWIAAVEWLVETYKAWVNTHEPAAAGEGQQVTQQHTAVLEGQAPPPVEPGDVVADLDWLVLPAQPGQSDPGDALLAEE